MYHVIMVNVHKSKSLFFQFIWWPREFNALKLKNRHANRQTSCKLTQHIREAHCTYLDTLVVKVCDLGIIYVVDCEWTMNCECLHHMCCQTGEDIFLICMCFSWCSALSSFSQNSFRLLFISTTLQHRCRPLLNLYIYYFSSIYI